MLETGIVSLILADSTLAGLIDARLYPVMLDENATYPCLTFQCATSNDDVALDESFTRTKRIQFDAWNTAAYKTVKQIVAALDALFEGFSGVLPGGDIRVLEVEKLPEIDGIQTESRRFRTTAEYSFLFTKT